MIIIAFLKITIITYLLKRLKSIYPPEEDVQISHNQYPHALSYLQGSGLAYLGTEAKDAGDS